MPNRTLPPLSRLLKPSGYSSILMPSPQGGIGQKLVLTLDGIVYGSMALLADGLHMGSHAVALGIAAFAYAYARKNAGSARFSFGTGKVNALGGFTGAILLAVFALYMVIESVGRFIQPVPISFDGAIFVAIIGLVVNGVSAWILGDAGHDHGHSHGHDHGHHHHHHDHNRRAAYLHVLADALTSVLAIVALLAGKYAGWNWMDPMMGIIGAILVTRWSWHLLKETSKVLLDEQHQDMEETVRQAVEDDDAKVSDLHVWAIGPNIHAAIVSVVSHQPESPTVYKKRIQAHCQSLVNHANHAFKMAVCPLQTFDNVRVRLMRVIIYHV